MSRIKKPLINSAASCRQVAVRNRSALSSSSIEIMAILQHGWTPRVAAIQPVHLAVIASIVFFGFPIFWLAIDYARVLKQRRRLPPGPFPIPVFGNYFQVPKYKPWVAWEQLSKKHDNPLITIWNGHRPVIICHDAWTISDLLEKRAAIYSSRPRMYAIGDMPDCTETNQPALVYGDKWRLHRRLMVSYFPVHMQAMVNEY